MHSTLFDEYSHQYRDLSLSCERFNLGSKPIGLKEAVFLKQKGVRHLNHLIEKDIKWMIFSYSINLKGVIFLN